MATSGQMPKALGPVFILNGPNLNLLGTREPEIYGVETLSDIETACARRAAELSFTAMFRQSNHEGWLIDWIHEASAAEAPIVINPGAYTHTSIALGDALRAVRTPKVEVHLSNIHAREAFRRISHVSPAVDGVICGLGAAGYTLALDAVKRLTEKRNKS